MSVYKWGIVVSDLATSKDFRLLAARCATDRGSVLAAEAMDVDPEDPGMESAALLLSLRRSVLSFSGLLTQGCW